MNPSKKNLQRICCSNCLTKYLVLNSNQPCPNCQTVYTFKKKIVPVELETDTEEEKTVEVASDDD